MAVSFKKFIDMFVPSKQKKQEAIKEGRINWAISRKIFTPVPSYDNYVPTGDESKLRAYQFRTRKGILYDFESAQRLAFSQWTVMVSGYQTTGKKGYGK